MHIVVDIGTVPVWQVHHDVWLARLRTASIVAGCAIVAVISAAEGGQRFHGFRSYYCRQVQYRIDVRRA